MATLVKIRSLDRTTAGTASSVGSLGPARGFRVKSQFQQAQGGTSMVKATLTPVTNTVSFTANYPGTWGNNVTITPVVGTLGVAVTYGAGTGNPTITVTAPATATLAANQAIVAAVNNNPAASQFVTAATAGTGAAAWAATGGGTLAGGSNGSGSTLNPIYLDATGVNTVVVDIDDPYNIRTLRRNYYRYVSLGLA